MAKLRSIESRLEKIEARQKQIVEQQKRLGDIPLSVYLGDGVVLTRLHSGHRIYLSANDATIAASLITHGRWEHWIETEIRSRVKPGMKVLDVGANHGYYTLIMGSMVGPEGHVFAFEANRDLSRLLSKSLCANGLQQSVTLCEQAAFSHATELYLHFDAEYSGAGSVSEAGTSTSVAVPAVPVDDVIPDDVELSFVKIDAEGSEYHVLQGMRKVLARSTQLTMIIEFYAPWVAPHMDPLAYLQKFTADGFTIRCLWESGPTGTLSAEQVLQQTGKDGVSYLLLER